VSVCWYCYWGWSKQVADIYDVHDGRINLDWSPAHVVWADENFDDGSIEFCLKECDEWDSRPVPDDGSNTEHFVSAVARQSLLELKAIPASIRCCEPEGYDGEHPENYPPPIGLVMVKR
jgi:hypothetical protein